MSYAHADALAYDPFAADAAADARAGFIRRTYLHLFGAIVAFMGIEAAFLSIEPLQQAMLGLVGGNWWIALIAFMAVSWLANRWATTGASPTLQYAGLALYTVAEALIFVPLLYFAQRIDSSIIPTAGFLTMLIFGGLTAIVFVSGADFSFLRGALTIGGLIAMGLVLVSVFTGFTLGLAFSAGMIALLSGYILYDTSNVLHHYRTDQHVAAALALFSSVATLFFYVVRLLSILSSDD